MVRQTPWIQRSFNFSYPISLFPVIFCRLEGSIFRLKSILQNADDKICSTQHDGWSVKEHIGHLYDLEELWWKRLDDFINSKEVLTAADMTNAKTDASNHNHKSLGELLNQFTMERQKMLEAIYGFDENILAKISLHPRLNTSMRLVDSLYFVAEHDDHHIAVISEMLRKV